MQYKSGKQIKSISLIENQTAAEMIMNIAFMPRFKSCRPRDLKIIVHTKPAVARSKVLLAIGEKKNKWLITRSVINLNMREQSLSQIIKAISRAIEQSYEKSNSSLIGISIAWA